MKWSVIGECVCGLGALCSDGIRVCAVHDGRRWLTDIWDLTVVCIRFCFWFLEGKNRKQQIPLRTFYRFYIIHIWPFTRGSVSELLEKEFALKMHITFPLKLQIHKI